MASELEGEQPRGDRRGGQTGFGYDHIHGGRFIADRLVDEELITQQLDSGTAPLQLWWRGIDHLQIGKDITRIDHKLRPLLDETI